MKDIYTLSVLESIHEASVVLLKNMDLLVFAEQERQSRYRHHHSQTVTADTIYKVLESENLKPEDITYFYYCNQCDFNNTFMVDKDLSLTVLKQIIGIDNFKNHWSNIQLLNKVKVNHHEQHCASSFYSSGFETALGLVIDGFGDLNDSITLFKCSRKDGIVELKKYEKRFSLGDFYSQASLGCKLGINSEGKLMGLASFYNSPTTYSNFDKETKEMKHEYLYDWYLEQPEFGGKRDMKDHIHYIRQAGEVQKIFNNTVLDIVEYLKSFDPNEENLVLSGGCILNCNCNGEIEKQGLFKNIYCFPATNDAGVALGAAYINVLSVLGDYTPKRLEHVFFGIDYPRSQSPLRLKSIKDHLIDINIKDVINDLKNDKVIAWYQGRSEVGPRALGHRSILASPCNQRNWDFINKEIKEREPFRPLAPIVLDKYYNDIFDDPNPENLTPFMLKTVKIKPEWRNKIPAVCHIDDTARPQYLKREVDPELYDLIEEFYKETGIPLLINTSLNGKGEPIVETIDNLMRFLELHNKVEYAIINGNKILKFHGDFEDE